MVCCSLSKTYPLLHSYEKNTRVPYGDKPLSVKHFFSHLRQGQSRLIEKEMYAHRLFFAGTRSKESGLVIAMTNQNSSALQILSKYQKRWSIEELFRKLKTSGFHWENSHPSRLISLLIILGLGILLAYLMGIQDKIPWKKNIELLFILCF